MEKVIKLVCAGFGGQGVLTIGQMVAMMGMKRDYLVSWMPSYGPEMRGGTANCHVVISEKNQQSPIITNDMTHLLAMNQLAKDKFLNQLSTNGMLISNAALVKENDYSPQIRCDFNGLASDIENIKTANMAAFGALIVTLDMFDISEGEKVIYEKFDKIDPQLLEDNIKAYHLGVKYAQSLLSK